MSSLQLLFSATHLNLNIHIDIFRPMYLFGLTNNLGGTRDFEDLYFISCIVST